MCIGCASTLAANDPPLVDRAELLLVDIRLNGRRVADFQDVLQYETQLWLPIEALMQAAEGLYDPRSETEVRFGLGSLGANVALNLDAQTLRVDDRSEPWPDEGIVVLFNQILIQQNLLEQWLGLSARLSDDLLTVHVDSQRPFPADLRRIRERRWARFDRPEFRIDPSYVALNEPYSLWGSPRGAFSFNTSLSTQQQEVNPSYNATVDVEALQLSHRVGLAGSVNSGLQSLRWTAGRSSPEGNVFGIAALQRVELGDVSSFRVPLPFAGGGGRGVVFSSAPAERPDLFDITTIEGEALPGWDVELYRGTELIDFIRVDDAGEFSFPDLPIGFGNNDYRVVLYGPQGEQEERLFRSRVGAGLLAPGEFQLRGSAVNTDTRMFPLREPNPTGGGLFNLRGDYGVSTHLTLGAFVAFEGVPERRLGQLQTLLPEPLSEQASVLRANYGISVRPRLADADTELIVVAQDGREIAFQANARGPIGGSNASATYEQFSQGYLSTSRQQSGRLLNSRWRLRSSHSLSGIGSLSLGYERAVLNTASVRQTFRPRLRHRLAGLAVAHEFDYSWQAQSEQLRYRGLATWRYNRQWTSRAQLTAGGSNLSTLEAQSLSGSADYRIDDRQLVGVSANYGLQSGRISSSIRYSYSQVVYPGRLSFSTGLNSEGAWSAGLGVSVGVGSSRQRWVHWIPPDSPSGGGAFSMRVFEDRNQSGQFDPEVDVPIAGAGVLVNNRPAEARSDDTGWLVVAGLPTDRRVAVGLDPDSLDDPFLAAPQPRVQFLPRAGFTHHVDMPLLDSGFASGTVTRFDRPVGGFEVVAERAGTGTRETTFSLSDGYFGFETLAPGTWQLQVNPNTLPEGWRSTVATVEIAEGQGIDQIDLQVLAPEADTP